MPIPRIIMQTWETADVPEKWKEGPKSIKKLMPDWDYVLLTNDDRYRFVRTYFPDFMTTFKNFRYQIQKADAIRYMWLYVKGGLYMDLKTVIVHPLDSLFEKGDLFLVNSGGKLVGNFMLASRSRHPIWLACLREMKKSPPWWAFGKFLYVLGTTGPLMLSKVISETKPKVTYLPKNLVSPCDICEVPCSKQGAYVKTLQGGSWLALDALIFKWIRCHWKNGLVMIILLVLLLFLFLIAKK